jgi:hypothetical protein
MALLADPAVDIQEYLEELLTLAVNSAQQAELVSLQTQRAGKHAKCAMGVVTCLAVLGVMVGVAGFAASRSSNFMLAQVRDEVTVLKEMQRRTHEQIAQIAASATDQRTAASVAAPAGDPLAQAYQPLPVTPAPTPAVWQPAVPKSTPWPDSVPYSAPPQRRPVATGHPGHPVVVPHFVTVIQRNVRAMFR